MIKLNLNGKIYPVQSDPKKISLLKFIEYREHILSDLPEFLEKGEPMQTEADRFALADLAARTLAFFSGAPMGELRAVRIDQLEHAWQSLLTALNVEEDRSWSGFVIGATRYFAPDRLMVKSTLEDYAESCQYEKEAAQLEQGELKAIFKIAATLSRTSESERLEDYDHNERTELFRSELSMYDGLQLGFFLRRRKRISSLVFRIFLAKQTLVRLKRGTAT